MCGPTTGAITSYSNNQLPPDANKPDSQKETTFPWYGMYIIEAGQKAQTTANKLAFLTTMLVCNQKQLPFEISNLIASFLKPDIYNLEPMSKYIGLLNGLHKLQSCKKGCPEQKREIDKISRAADYFSIDFNEDETHRNIFFKTMLRKKATDSIISAINALSKNGWTITLEGQTMQSNLRNVLLKVFECNSRLPHEFISPVFLGTLFDILKQPVCETSEQIGASTDEIRELACELLEMTVGYAREEEEGEWIRCALLNAGILDLAATFVESAAAPESSQQYKLIIEKVNLKLSELLVIFHTHSPLLQWNGSRRIVETLALLLSQIETEADQGNKVAKEIRRNCEKVILRILLLLDDETYEEGIELLIEILPYSLYNSIFPYCLHTEEETSLLQQQTTFSGKSDLLRNQLKPALIRLSNEFYLEKERLRKMMLFGGTHALNSLPLALECNRLTKQIMVIAGELPHMREANELKSFLMKALLSPELTNKKTPSIVQNLCSIANIMVIDKILNSLAVYLCLSTYRDESNWEGNAQINLNSVWERYEGLISVFKFPVNETGKAIITNEKQKLLVEAALHVLILLMDTEKRIQQERDRGNTDIDILPAALQTLKDLYLRQELIKFLPIQDLADLAKDVISRCSNDDSSIACADKEQVTAVRPCGTEDIERIVHDLSTLNGLQECQRDIPPQAVVAALNLFFNSQHASWNHKNTFLNAIINKNKLPVIFSALDTLTKSELIKTRVGQEIQYQLISVLSGMFERNYRRMLKENPDERPKILLNGMKALLHLNRDHVRDLGFFVEIFFKKNPYDPLHKDTIFSGLELVIMLLESTDDEVVRKICCETLCTILEHSKDKKDLIEKFEINDRFLPAISKAFSSCQYTSIQICEHLIRTSDTLTIRLFDEKYHVLVKLWQLMSSKNIFVRGDAHSLIFNLLKLQPKIFKKLIGNNPHFVKPLLAGMIKEDKNLNLKSLICLGNMIGTDDGVVEQLVREGMTWEHFDCLMINTLDLVYNDTSRSLLLLEDPIDSITSPVSGRELPHLRLQLPLDAVLNLFNLLLNSEESPSLSPDGNNRFLEMFQDMDLKIWEDLRAKYPHVSQKVDRLLEKLGYRNEGECVLL